jgi:hypothetical protein
MAGFGVTAEAAAQTEDFFKRLRVILWGIFEVLLLLLAIAAIVVLAWQHIPRLSPGDPRPVFSADIICTAGDRRAAAKGPRTVKHSGGEDPLPYRSAAVRRAQ